jgi:YD repeat-containing protein
VQQVVRSDGTKIGLEYDKAGRWLGFSFPDGGRMRFIRDDAGKIIGFKRIAKSARHLGGGARFVRASLAQDPEACRAAIRAAAYAAAAAAALCTAGPSIECALALAAAAEMTYIAYRTCRGPGGDKPDVEIIMM